MPQKIPSGKGVAVGLPANIEAVVKTAAEIQKVMANGINGDGSLKSEAIRALIKIKGINLKVLAETNGFFDTHIHRIINREYPDTRVRRLLAKTLEVPYECIWGKKAEEAEVANAS